MRETERVQPGIEAEARRLLTAAFETAPVRPGLAAALAAAGSPAGPPGDVVGLVRRRAARRRRARVLVPAGAAAVAAAVAGGLTAGAVTGSGGAAAPGARAVLDAALTRTSAQPFAFSTSAEQLTKGGTPATRPEGITGEFDPATGNSTETVHLHRAPDQTYRFIGKSVYATGLTFVEHKGQHKPWVKFRALPPPGVQPPAFSIAQGITDQRPFDPAGLLNLLKSAATVTLEGPASGNGWTGTRYRFTATTVEPVASRPGGTVSISVSGTVSVDSSGRVREMSSVTGPVGPVPSVAVTVTFGDFGAPVTVTAPPASQVYDAGNVNYAVITYGGTV